MKLLAILALYVLASPAGAWGEMGHRITGHIAKQLLTPTARAKLTQIMGNDDLPGMSLFLDMNRDLLEKEIPRSREWHYDNRPVCDVRQSREKYCPEGDCASIQLERHAKILADSRSSLEAKRLAIYVLTHVIGDIHQPLHAADDNDAGGNRMKLSLPWITSFSSSAISVPNLHSLWDTHIIEKMYAGRTAQTVANVLWKHYSPRQNTWMSGSVRGWMDESYALARSKVYTKSVGFTCGPEDEDRIHAVPMSYIDAAAPVIEEQLAKAGARIAYVLNNALR